MKPTATFEWRMPSRAQGWIRAWDAQAATYHEDYVSPIQWPVILDATKSKGGGFAIVRYHWEIKGLDGNPFSLTEDNVPVNVVIESPGQPTSDTTLAAIFSKNLPRLGRYGVTLTVTNANGEVSDLSSQIIRAQDLLIVSMGDSMASGEGNPDMAGSALLDEFDSAFPDNPVWTDRRCHRSRRSGHALAAQALEWQHRSVTFLSFACSGARVVGGVIGTYDGIDAPDGPHDPLPSQIEAAAKAIGGKRVIDVLLVTGGLNDLGVGSSDGFSSVIKAFATPGGDSDTAKEIVTRKLKTMPHVYDRLAWELSRRLHNQVKRVYLTEYPYHIFQPRRVAGVSNEIRQGCGALSAITFGEGDFLFEKGRELVEMIHDATQRHDAHFVSGIKNAFEGRGYCDDPTFYVAFSDSLFKEGTIDGTIHPNGQGHKAIANQIVQQVMQPVRDITHRPKKVTVIFDRMKVIAPAGVPADAQVSLQVNGQEKRRAVSMSQLNQDIVLPAVDFTLSFIVDDGLAGRFVEITGSTRFFRLNPEEPGTTPPGTLFTTRFDAKANYGAGAHAHTHEGSSPTDLEVHYHILVEDAPNPNLPSLAPTTDVRVSVVFEKIKILAPGTDAVPNTTREPVLLGANGFNRSIGPVALNQEIALTEQDFTLRFLVDGGQADPFFTVTGSTVLPKISPEDPDAKPRDVGFSFRFGPRENFGAGNHLQIGPGIVVDFKTGIAVNFRITAQQIGAPPVIGQL